jgi:peptidoglycan/LPS O-acetylase OafA/YrhL
MSRRRVGDTASLQKRSREQTNLINYSSNVQTWQTWIRIALHFMRVDLTSGDQKTSQSVHLDAVRGVAALVVVLHHARMVTLLPRESVSIHLSPIIVAFYWISGFANAHNAVLVFFVLSGYLVGGSVIRNIAANRWSWKSYAADRLTRLYIVLIPALLLTAGLDYAIKHAHRVIEMIPDSNLDHFSDSLSTFLGNSFFLQKIYCAPFGSDISLWSLSYEFWYYLAFPFLAIGVLRAKTLIGRAACIGAAAAAYILMRSAAWLFPVWMLGTSLYYLKDWRLVPQRWHRPLLLLTVAGMVMHSAVAARMSKTVPVISQWVFGVLVFFLLFLLLQMEVKRPLAKAYVSVARYLSSRSYTIYLVHAPVIVALIAFSGHEYSEPVPSQIALSAILFAVAILCSEVMYRLFERHTPLLREYVYAKFGIPLRATVGNAANQAYLQPELSSQTSSSTVHLDV